MTGYTLSPQTITELRKGQKILHGQLPAVQALQQCGYECQQLEETIAELDRRITALLTHFGRKGAVIPDVPVT